MQNQTYRLLIVDDHPLVRSGIRAILQLESDLEVCGEATWIATWREQMQVRWS